MGLSQSHWERALSGSWAVCTKSLQPLLSWTGISPKVAVTKSELLHFIIIYNRQKLETKEVCDQRKINQIKVTETITFFESIKKKFQRKLAEKEKAYHQLKHKQKLIPPTKKNLYTDPKTKQKKTGKKSHQNDHYLSNEAFINFSLFFIILAVNCFSFSFLLTYMNYQRVFIVIFWYMHIMYFDWIHVVNFWHIQNMTLIFKIFFLLMT
jgi:hypothetical protein